MYNDKYDTALLFVPSCACILFLNFQSVLTNDWGWLQID